MRCGCGKTVEPKAGKKERLPAGWHRQPKTELPLCPKCWGERYILRAVTIPVAGPVSCEWPEFRQALKTAWQRATRLTNLAVQSLLKRDVVRTAKMTKLPPMPAGNLYQDCMVEDYAGWSQSAAAILRQTEAKYRAKRYERIWLGQTTLPNARYPQPYPIHNANWTAAWMENGERVPHVTVTLPEVGRITLRLRGGQDFRRQLAAFAQIVSGTAIQGELSLYEQRVNSGDHRNGTTERDGGGGKFQTRVMCKMVAWLPRQEAKELDGTLFVRTDADALLIALDAKDERVWIHNADHLPRWVAEHRRRLNRWADDQKAEQRPVASFTGRRERACLKHRNRMDSATHEAAAQLVNFASRRKFAVIRYDDSCKSFVREFPWDRLKRLIIEKSDAAGIEVEVVATGSVPEKVPDPLAETQGVN
jgi:hypothetical protein